MPSLFRRCLLPVAAILLLASGASGCKSIPCLKEKNQVWIENAYTRDIFATGAHVYDKPDNTWVDNPKMAVFIADYVKENGVKWLGIRYGFECAPKPGGDCPDYFVCTLSRSGVVDYFCQPDGDLFVKAEIGPGTSVRAQTYWRR
ncbi:MAG: hypothetical protein HYZ40_08905 [Rhodospirillales bacterium]|nr:hypothetical protein [Rhodospirillales bacterium]